MVIAWIYKTHIGDITIIDRDGFIGGVHFGDCTDGRSVGKTPLTDAAASQLEEYFEGRRRIFDLPLAPEGTDFQRAVWDALLLVPYGQTRSYKQIASDTGRPLACRAVGMANNRNPIAIIIPCHRIIGSDGKMVGYGGGLDVKIRLLAMEAGKVGYAGLR